MALILIVDDSQYAGRVHTRVLESGGHQVIESSSGAEALEAFALRKPDVVMLDMTMNDMGGAEVLAKLRELDPGVSVVVVSADVQRSTEEAVLAAGARAFVGKPASPHELLDAVAAAARPA